MKDKIISYLMKRMRIEVAVAGIISNGDKVLLTKRALPLVDGGKWCLPGGHVNKWERAEECVKREVKEEVNLNCDGVRLLFVHEEFVKRLNLHAVVFVYSLDVSGVIEGNIEVSDFKWFSRKDVEELDMAFTHRDILERYWREK